MAKRPAVRRGRKNPNAGISQAAEHQSVQLDFSMSENASTNHGAPSDGSLTQGATNLRTEMAAEQSGTKQATVGHRKYSAQGDEELRIFPMSGAVDRTAEFETRRALDKKLDAILGKNEEDSDAEPVSEVEDSDAEPVLEVEDRVADHEPEVTETGSVLFDAVLPKGHGIGQIGRKIASKNVSHHASRQADEKIENGPETHEAKEALSIDENPRSERRTARREKVVQSEEETHASEQAVVVSATQQGTVKPANGKAAVSVYDLKKDRESVEKRIQAEVERRVSQAETELEPQVIISPKAVKRSRLTMSLVALGIVALALISIILGINYDRMNRTLTQANQELDFYKGLMNGENVQASEPTETAGSSGQAGAQVRKEDETRRVYLTFDDGPSEVTVETLDILATYGVKATFFVNGRDDDRSTYIYNRIVDEGHTLAMHGDTHDFDTIYASLGNFSEDLHKLRNLLYDKTGGRVWCKYYRFPGGSSTTTAKTDMKELIAYLDREGITYYDWNVYGGDDIDAATIISNIKASTTKYKNVIILMHDAADKKATVEALPGIIEYLQGLEDTVLLPITDDTVPIQHGVQ